MSSEKIAKLIRDIPDFPKPGILFKDITPLLANAEGFRAAVDMLAEGIDTHRADALVGIESRGFIFASALSMVMGKPLKLVRKSGKLPFETVFAEYELEYGSDRVEIHTDAVAAGRRYAIVDDLIATGGTAGASIELIEGQGGVVACLAFIIELEALKGRDRCGDKPVVSLLKY